MSNASPIDRSAQVTEATSAVPAKAAVRTEPPRAKRLAPSSSVVGITGSAVLASGDVAAASDTDAGGMSQSSSVVSKSGAGGSRVPSGSPSTAARTRQPIQAKPLPTYEQLSDEFEDEFEYYDEPLWREVVRRSPSLLTSMVLHVVVLLVMALMTVDDGPRPIIRELVVDTAELEEPLEEFKDEKVEQKADTPVEVNKELSQHEALSVSEEDFKIDSEEMVVPAEADEAELKMSVEVQVEELNVVDHAASDLLAHVGGISKTGLGGRTPAGRATMVRKSGGTADSERAVEAALTWLAQRQLRDGSWSFQQIGAATNPGKYTTRQGATGLALLPFLGAGYTHESGKYEENIRAALAYMVGNMAVSGGRGRLYESTAASQAHMYSHGIAAIALCEAYGMTGDAKLRTPAQYSLNYISWAQDPKSGGWLYTPRSSGGDTSVVGWQLMALKSGHMAGLVAPPVVVGRASHWLDTVQSNSGAAYGYRKAGDRSAASAMSAVGLLMRMYMGWDHNNPALQMGVQAIGKAGPSNSDMYYNYYATQVLRHYDGPEWEQWNGEMRDYLIKTQARQGANTGSWYFGGGHGSEQAGRLYHTALATMILEVYYRHLPIYQKKSAEEEFPVN